MIHDSLCVSITAASGCGDGAVAAAGGGGAAEGAGGRTHEADEAGAVPGITGLLQAADGGA